MHLIQEDAMMPTVTGSALHRYAEVRDFFNLIMPILATCKLLTILAPPRKAPEVVLTNASP